MKNVIIIRSIGSTANILFSLAMPFSQKIMKSCPIILHSAVFADEHLRPVQPSSALTKHLTNQNSSLPFLHSPHANQPILLSTASNKKKIIIIKRTFPPIHPTVGLPYSTSLSEMYSPHPTNTYRSTCTAPRHTHRALHRRQVPASLFTRCLCS